jgi:hypothetical protein
VLVFVETVIDPCFVLHEDVLTPIKTEILFDFSLIDCTLIEHLFSSDDFHKRWKLFKMNILLIIFKAVKHCFLESTQLIGLNL